MKNKYMFGGIIIVVFLGLMSYLFTQTNVRYQEDFSKIESTKGRTVKAAGAWVKEKNYSVDKEKNIFSFFVKDNDGREMKVVYEGTIPNNFEISTSVVITGRYENGYFHADEILTKCPSKYEGEDFEEHPDNAQTKS